MKTYTVYQHPVRGLEAVKMGFSWPALLFSLFWMVTHRLWRVTLVWVTVYAVAVALVEWLAPGVWALNLSSAVLLALLIIAGGRGNAWREAALSRRGYRVLQTVKADSPAIAVAVAAAQSKT